MSESAAAEAVLLSVKAAVQQKKGARALVEALRGASLLAAPAPPLFPTLLAALQQLKCNKKAGEENKAVRHCYQYISWLASSGLLSEEQALQVMFQLTGIDLRDELVPRQLAALQLFAELAARFPAAAGAWRGSRAGDGPPPPPPR
jgi:hypothetical protein